jgi:hypothetical protein
LAAVLLQQHVQCQIPAAAALLLLLLLLLKAVQALH